SHAWGRGRGEPGGSPVCSPRRMRGVLGGSAGAAGMDAGRGGRVTDTMRLVGYADPLVVRPGGTVRFMVSSSAGDYESEIVRLVHGDPNPAGPGMKIVP